MTNDVMVIGEHFQGALSQITLELLGKARELAGPLGGKVEVVLLGHAVEPLTAQLGAADRLSIADHPLLEHFVPETYEAVIAQRIKQAGPRLVLLGSTSVGLDLIGPLSVRAAVPCFDNCTSLQVREGRVVAISQLYGGKIFAEYAVPETTALVAVVPGSFPAEPGKAAGAPEVLRLAAPPAPRTTFRRLIEPPPGDVDVSKVPLLVAVGRGIQNADNIPLAQELAETLGGAVCASRPVIDQGWLPLTRQVGKSGVTVKPKLYLALGISGAPEHVEGMKQSELIIAVNTDANAPIFGLAHYGAVADAVEIIPLLTEQIRAASG
jgi:electron transfer flavoprotein alpha subunit